MLSSRSKFSFKHSKIDVVHSLCATRICDCRWLAIEGARHTTLVFCRFCSVSDGIGSCCRRLSAAASARGCCFGAAVITRQNSYWRNPFPSLNSTGSARSFASSLSHRRNLAFRHRSRHRLYLLRSCVLGLLVPCWCPQNLGRPAASPSPTVSKMARVQVPPTAVDDVDAPMPAAAVCVEDDDDEPTNIDLLRLLQVVQVGQ